MSGLMEVAAVLSVFSQPQNADVNQVRLWSEGCLTLVREGLEKPGKGTWSNVWVEYLIATLHVPSENSQVMYSCQLKMEVQICKKNDNIFKHILKSLYQNRQHGSFFLPFIGQCLPSVSQCSVPCITIICHNLSWPSLCLGCSPHKRHSAVAEWWVHVWGLGWASQQGRAAAMME